MKDTSDERGKKILRRLPNHVNFANKVFIVYYLLAIIFSAPLVIFKEDNSGSCINSAVAINTSTVISIALVPVATFDVGRNITTEMDFNQM